MQYSQGEFKNPDSDFSPGNDLPDLPDTPHNLVDPIAKRATSHRTSDLIQSAQMEPSCSHVSLYANNRRLSASDPSS